MAGPLQGPAAGSLDRTPYSAGRGVTAGGKIRSSRHHYNSNPDHHHQPSAGIPRRGPYDRPPGQAARRGAWIGSRILSGASSILSSLFGRDGEEDFTLLQQPPPPPLPPPAQYKEIRGNHDANFGGSGDQIEDLLKDRVFTREQCDRFIKVLQSKLQPSIPNGVVTDRDQRYPDEELERERERHGERERPRLLHKDMDQQDDTVSSPVDIAKAYMDKRLSPVPALTTPVHTQVYMGKRLSPVPTLATPGHTPFVRLRPNNLRAAPLPVERKRRVEDDLEYSGRRTKLKMTPANGPPVSFLPSASNGVYGGNYSDRMRNLQRRRLEKRSKEKEDALAVVPSQSSETARRILETLESLTPPKVKTLSPSMTSERARKTEEVLAEPSSLDTAVEVSAEPAEKVKGKAVTTLSEPSPKTSPEPSPKPLPPVSEQSKGFRMNAAIEESLSDDEGQAISIPAVTAAAQKEESFEVLNTQGSKTEMKTVAMFGAAGPQIFGSATETKAFASPQVFVSATETKTAAWPQIFGSTTETKTASGPQIFGYTTETQTAPAPPIFGSTTEVKTAAAPQLFGSATDIKAPQLFGSAAEIKEAAAPQTFGSATEIKTAPAPQIFGELKTAPAPQMFGSATELKTTEASVTEIKTATAPLTFGFTPEATAPQTFGFHPEMKTATPQLFGSTTEVKQAAPPIPAAESKSAFTFSSTTEAKQAAAPVPDAESKPAFTFSSATESKQPAAPVPAAESKQIFPFSSTTETAPPVPPAESKAMFTFSSPPAEKKFEFTAAPFSFGANTNSIFGAISSPTGTSSAMGSGDMEQDMAEEPSTSVPTSQASPFGNTSAPAAPSFLFGNTPALPATPSFGAPSFGSFASQPFGSQSSIFGSADTGNKAPTPAAAPVPFVFGAAPAFGATSSFGAQQTTSPSFGGFGAQPFAFGAQQPGAPAPAAAAVAAAAPAAPVFGSQPAASPPANPFGGFTGGFAVGASNNEGEQRTRKLFKAKRTGASKRGK